MWRYLRRQWGTKTGKYGMALVVGTVANAIFGDAETGNAVLQVANGILTPETGVLGLAAMFLRDKEAKKEEEIKLEAEVPKKKK